MSSPKDATIATVTELNKLTAEFGVFSIAENATDQAWITRQRAKFRRPLRKPRKSCGA